MTDICGSELAAGSNAKCPVCKGESMPVPEITVRSLVHKLDQVEIDAGQQYFLCVAPDCEVVYFNQDGQIFFTRREIKVPVWFKEKESPVPICYCRGVTDTEILDHVANRQCCSTLEDIRQHTGAKSGHDCLTTNPTGR